MKDGLYKYIGMGSVKNTTFYHGLPYYLTFGKPVSGIIVALPHLLMYPSEEHFLKEWEIIDEE